MHYVDRAALACAMRVRFWSIAAVLFACAPWVHAAEFNALLSIDPSDKGFGAFATAAPAASLTRALGVPAQLLASNNLKDAMRATRTTENQVIIGPAHVTASALSHGYALVAVSGRDTRFALVVRRDITSPQQLRGARLYLPQQDSLRSYVAKGLLEQIGLSFKTFREVSFRNTSGAGLVAIGLGMAEATVSEAEEAQRWVEQNPGQARILQTSREIPGGFAVAVLKSVPEADRRNLVRWATSTPAPISGLGTFEAATGVYEEKFGYVASLGIVTPDAIAGATRVTAEQLRDLEQKSRIVIADTRSPREYAQEHIPAAVSAPYGEKSLKERDYDAKLDDLSAIAKLDRSQPTVFLCNGPECWKSYKASREAVAMGFKTVYWFRGGMPEWRERGLATVKPSAQVAHSGK